MNLLNSYVQLKHILQFLMGLNETFTFIQDQILLMEHLPSMNIVFLLFYKKNNIEAILLLLIIIINLQSPSQRKNDQFVNIVKQLVMLLINVTTCIVFHRNIKLSQSHNPWQIKLSILTTFLQLILIFC